MNKKYKTALALLVAATVWSPPGSQAYASPATASPTESTAAGVVPGELPQPADNDAAKQSSVAPDGQDDTVSNTPAIPSSPSSPTAPADSAADEAAEQRQPGADSSDAEPRAISADSSVGKLILVMNSDQTQMNGQTYVSPRPTTVRQGVSYVGLRFMTERLGGTITHDAASGETVVRVRGAELRYRNGSAEYVVDGEKRSLRGAVYADRYHMMVPFTSIATALKLRYTVQGKSIVVDLADKPVARFEVSARTIETGQTIEYTTSGYSPQGLAIVDERWEGWQSSFDAPGTYTISYTVQDETGVWSDPYTITIEVEAPHVPPVAEFRTDKTTYRMGEPIRYIDESTAGSDTIVDRKWDNGKPAFFEPGMQTVTLTLKDKRGATSQFSTAILITEERLYTEEEFGLRYAPPGTNMPIDSVPVLQLDALPYSYTTEPETLFRSSGPESVFADGVLYEDVIEGDTRLLLHHKNRMDQRTKLYLIAENTGTQTAELRLTGEGLAGPTVHAEIAGRMSLSRYLAAEAAGGGPTIRLAPGERVLLFDSLTQAKSLAPGDIVTFTGSVKTKGQIRYASLMVGERVDPLEALDSLPRLDPRESIVRGTFADANRVFRYDGSLGGRPQRLSLTDNSADPFQSGTDGIHGGSAVNSGNYGLMYKLQLNNVAPNTVIAFNPRGGLYVGAVRVNGEVVGFSHLGMASATREASVLYRTGDRAEAVELWISPSAGSNLPFALLFLPVPEARE